MQSGAFFLGQFRSGRDAFFRRPAPPHPGGIPHLPDAITREAYSQEVSSLGFWPGNAAAPRHSSIPMRILSHRVSPGKDATGRGFLHPQLHEFILPYDEVRSAEITR